MSKSHSNTSYDVIVIGGGHAGCEAAAAAARAGAATVLVTHKRETIGEMSCNPAIGGLAKGQLVREIDALDGLMGRAMMRLLSSSACSISRKGRPCGGHGRKQIGPCIGGLCKTCWRKKTTLLLLKDRSKIPFFAKRSADRHYFGDRRHAPGPKGGGDHGYVLRGLIHIGETQIPAGRVHEAPAIGLSYTFKRLGFALDRLKRGTPPRLNGATIKWDGLDRQARRRVTSTFFVHD